MADITNLMEAASNELPTDDALVEVSKLAALQISLEDDIAMLENQLAEKMDALKSVRDEFLPSKMNELGITRIDLSDGSKVEIKQGITASITKDRERDAFSWLRANGFDDLIKHEIKATFGKGEEQDARAAVEALKAQGIRSLSDKESVHPSTLKAFVKEQLERGVGIPFETFGVYQYSTSKITRS